MATAAIGHNQPPDPFEAFTLHIEDLYEQAQQFLDGEPIATEGQAEDVSRLLNMLRKAKTDADEARKIEKKPHDDAARAVQAKWQPLIGKAELAATTAKNALAPFLISQEAAQREAAAALRKEAEQKAAAVSQLDISPDNLAGQQYLKAARQEAASIAKEADRADRKRAQARGGERAVGLRSVWTPSLTDPVAALRHYRERRPEELKEWLLEQAEKDVRAGARSIPGFEISEMQKAV